MLLCLKYFPPDEHILITLQFGPIQRKTDVELFGFRRALKLLYLLVDLDRPIALQGPVLEFAAPTEFSLAEIRG